MRGTLLSLGAQETPDGLLEALNEALGSLATLTSTTSLPVMGPRLAGLCAAVAVMAWPRRPSFLTQEHTEPDDPARSLRPRLGVARRRPAEAGSGTAELAEALVPCLAAGLPPASALRIAAWAIAPGSTAAAGARAAAEDAARGLPVGKRLHEAAVQARDDDLDHLARAWQLSESLGAPLGDAVATSARAVRERQAVSRKLGAATAGAHASMGVLALLPVVGPLAGLLLGVSPVQLFASRVSAVSAVLGMALAASGWAWARALVRRAARPRSL